MLRFLLSRPIRKQSPPPFDRHRPRPCVNFRPRVERMEERDVPATITWLGGSIGDPNSWDLGRLPVSTDDVTFDGYVSNASMTVPGGLGLSFNSIQLINGYAGTISGGGSGGSLTLDTLLIESGSIACGGYLTVGTLQMEGGSLSGDGSGMTVGAWQMDAGAVTAYGAVSASTLTMSGGTAAFYSTFSTASLNLTGGTIDQQSSSADITVTTNFDWTGGTLNSTANEANINIQGSGAISLPTSGTLYCGSTLNFLNPTAAAVETLITGAGTLLQTGGTGIYVGANAKVRQVASPGAVGGVDSVNKTLTLDWGAEWGYEGSGTALLGHRVINDGGRFYLNGQVTLTMTGGDANTPAYTQNAGVWPFTTQLEIQNGCIMDARTSKGVLINGGQVWLKGNTDLPVAEQFAGIAGTFTMTGGSIGFETPTQIGTELVWGAFSVGGDVVWSGGTFTPGINCAPGAPATGSAWKRGNQWLLSGTMTIDTGGPSQPTITPVPQFLPQGQQPSGTWDVIVATGTGKIQGGTPTVPAGWTAQASFAPNGVDKTKWSVTR